MNSFLGPLDRTPRTDEKPACLSCKNVIIQRGVNGSTEYRCGGMSSATGPKLLTQPVVFCSIYYPRNEPWIHEYESLAWVWSSDHEGEPRFVRSRDLLSGNYPAPRRVGF